eukprot:gene22215-29278_t
MDPACPTKSTSMEPDSLHEALQSLIAAATALHTTMVLSDLACGTDEIQEGDINPSPHHFGNVDDRSAARSDALGYRDGAHPHQVLLNPGCTARMGGCGQEGYHAVEEAHAAVAGGQIQLGGAAPLLLGGPGQRGLALDKFGVLSLDEVVDLSFTLSGPLRGLALTCMHEKNKQAGCMACEVGAVAAERKRGSRAVDAAEGDRGGRASAAAEGENMAREGQRRGGADRGGGNNRAGELASAVKPESVAVGGERRGGSGAGVGNSREEADRRGKELGAVAEGDDDVMYSGARGRCTEVDEDVMYSGARGGCTEELVSVADGDEDVMYSGASLTMLLLNAAVEDHPMVRSSASMALSVYLTYSQSLPEGHPHKDVGHSCLSTWCQPVMKEVLDTLACSAAFSTSSQQGTRPTQSENLHTLPPMMLLIALLAGVQPSTTQASDHTSPHQNEALDWVTQLVEGALDNSGALIAALSQGLPASRSRA